tara:strand:+ start:521 stop:685 length:165 start_codon:yes stop_codon:yes gene_type:complete
MEFTNTEWVIVVSIILLGFYRGGQEMKQVSQGKKAGVKRCNSFFDYIMLRDIFK